MIDGKIKSTLRAPRGWIAMAVVALHAGLVLLLLHSLMPAPVIAPPLIVSVISAPVAPLAPLAFHRPLMPAHPLVIQPPEFALPSDASAPVAADLISTSNDAPPPPASSRAAPPELPAMSDVAYLQRPAPRYPPQSRRAREEGLVILRVVIDHTGRVVSVDIQRSSGHPRLDEAARNAVAAALFKPYMADGVARPASAVIPIEFSLRAASS